MSRINKANIKKAWYFLKRNGIRNACYAVAERLEEEKKDKYLFVPTTPSELERQRNTCVQFSQTFSIVVPTYHTKEKYLRELIDCIREQTYPRWELILADATEDNSVLEFVKGIVGEKLQLAEEIPQPEAAEEKRRGCWQDSVVRYIRLPGNNGIAENTNSALHYVKGEYTGLLDHDDVLTADALYEMASAIEDKKKSGVDVQMLYSDEDKCDGEARTFYEPNIKLPFNIDLLLSNNYICHFLVMKSRLIKKLGFRAAYDGAQDYDLVLRAAAELMTKEEQIAYVPKVLYHWRCHTASTAENPRSKMYAYEAGGRALQDFAKTQKWKVTIEPLKHLGFYRLNYQRGILEERPDIGAVGGRLLVKNRTAGGGMSAQGEILYFGLPKGYSGYRHRALLGQDVEALDIRFIQLQRELWSLFEKVVGVAYTTSREEEFFDASTLPMDADYIQLSLQLSKAIREKGYRLLYTPHRVKEWKE